MPMLRKSGWLAFILLPLFLGGCGSLLPKGESETDGSWQTFWEAQNAFDKIIPHQTSIEELKKLHLDPKSNSNITILNYSDVLRRFIPGPNINVLDLDAGVQECISAKKACKGYEINQQVLKRKRYGNFLADFLNFKRKVVITGWRFNGLVLIKDDLVVYKLSGGEPNIHQSEEKNNPLGPFQGGGE